jgi:DnaK suppressor protein
MCDLMGINQTDLAARFRARLEAELADLLASSETSAEDRAPVRLDQQSVGRLARMDAMQVQAMAAAAEQRRQMRIARVRAALSRIADGEYGYCMTCADPISERRLEVDATAHLCVSCAQLQER